MRVLLPDYLMPSQSNVGRGCPPGNRRYPRCRTLRRCGDGALRLLSVPDRRGLQSRHAAAVCPPLMMPRTARHEPRHPRHEQGHPRHEERHPRHEPFRGSICCLEAVTEAVRGSGPGPSRRRKDSSAKCGPLRGRACGATTGCRSSCRSRCRGFILLSAALSRPLRAVPRQVKGRDGTLHECRPARQRCGNRSMRSRLT